MALERNPAIETDPFRGSDDAVKQQAKIDFMRRRNADRVKRLLNSKQRAIGADPAALARQIQEREEAKLEEQEETQKEGGNGDSRQEIVVGAIAGGVFAAAATAFSLVFITKMKVCCKASKAAEEAATRPRRRTSFQRWVGLISFDNDSSDEAKSETSKKLFKVDSASSMV